MPDVIDTSLDEDDGPLVDPPLVDLLYYEPAGCAYVVTFIPEDAVSTERTESVHVPESSPDGERIGVWLERLDNLLELGGPVSKVFHRGSGDFGFYGPDESQVFLSQPGLSSAVSQEAYGALQDMAQTAQIAFLVSRRPPEHHLKTIQPRPIAVALRDGHVLAGSAESNNASWLCACGYRTPLLGTTRNGAGDTRCPNCGRVYRTDPHPHRGERVSGVREVEPARATG